MKQSDAINRLMKLSKTGRCVYTAYDLGTLFYEDSDRALKATLRRLIDAGLLERVAHGTYVFAHHQADKQHVLESIAVTLRRGCHTYISLETALSWHDRISQMPIDRLTLMTTGKSHEFITPYGVLEMTHTARPYAALAPHMISPRHVLPLATPELAERDLRRVGRNVHMLNEVDD